MKNLSKFTLLLLALYAASCQVLDQATPSSRLAKAEDDIRQAKIEEWKLFPLGEAAMASVDTGDYVKAKRYADELLRLAHDLFPGREPDADSVHKGNLVLGRLELRSGNIEQAKRYLLESAKVSGSPSLSSFGPNMTLAKELLEKGEREAVLEYFDSCARFWKRGQDQLKRWSAEVQAGRVPDFGANLLY